MPPKQDAKPDNRPIKNKPPVINSIIIIALLLIIVCLLLPGIKHPSYTLDVTDSFLSIIVEIIFILLVIVMGIEIFSIQNLNKEYKKLEETKRKIDKRYKNIIYKYKLSMRKNKQLMKYDNLLVRSSFVFANPTRIATAPLSLIEDLTELRKSFPYDTGVLATIAYLYHFNKEYEKEVKLYSDYIDLIEKTGILQRTKHYKKYITRLGFAYYDQACAYAFIHKVRTGLNDQQKTEIINQIKTNLKKALEYNYTTTSEIKVDPDLKDVISLAACSDLFPSDTKESKK